MYSELFDIINLKRNSKIDNRELYFQARFNWTQKEIDEFLKIYHKQIMEKSNFLPGAKTVLKLLKDDGHNLILITSRGKLDESMIKLTEKVLRKSGLDIFDKYYWATEDKAKICKKEKIDVMIDDYIKNCQKIANEKIKTIYLKDAPSFDLEESRYIKVLYNWGEIYRYIKDLESK